MDVLRSTAKGWHKIWITRQGRIDHLRRSWLENNKVNARVENITYVPGTQEAVTSTASIPVVQALLSRALSQKLPYLPNQSGIFSTGMSKLVSSFQGVKAEDSSEQRISRDDAQLSRQSQKPQPTNSEESQDRSTFFHGSAKSPFVSDGTGKKEKTPRSPRSYVDDGNSRIYSNTTHVLTNGRINFDESDHIKNGIDRDIKHAPLLSGNVVIKHTEDLIPQYGLLGYQSNKDHRSLETKIFQNTNVPFSTFVCGVQGSGKSHTTACMLENVLIRSTQLGHLEAPASALVFQYNKWNSGMAGRGICEAAHLARPDPSFPGHGARKVTVLVSPTNLAIRNQYEGLPNVRTIPFKINPKSLNIQAFRTLMGVENKNKNIPLYIARVESIVRDIACKSKDGCLDYRLFQKRVLQEKFDATQKNLLDMRLELLESFLDLSGKAAEPEFRAGELTIVDLTDNYLTPSDACTLFKVALDSYLKSSVDAKMVVLDEAHKYMDKTAGSKLLTDCLSEAIRTQRHGGLRVIVSTQEPTVAMDLIAHCSVIVLHRFTSPTWGNTLKKYISALEDDKAIMKQIEGLQTGEALVYAPNAVLGIKNDGSLIKAPGRLLHLIIRKRVTRDGGESIMAVSRK